MPQCRQLPSGRAGCDSTLESPLPSITSHPQHFSLGSSGGLVPWCLGLSSASLVSITPEPPAQTGSLSRWAFACQPHLQPCDPPSAKGHQTHRGQRRSPGKTGMGAKRWLCALLPQQWLWAGHCPGSQKERRCCPWLIAVHRCSPQPREGEGDGQQGLRRGTVKNYLLFPPQAPGTIPL